MSATAVRAVLVAPCSNLRAPWRGAGRGWLGCRRGVWDLRRPGRLGQKRIQYGIHRSNRYSYSRTVSLDTTVSKTRRTARRSSPQA
eukprot:2828171-Prymnesium_polylepis.2